MRKLILAASALAFLSSTALAQTTAPAPQSGDTAAKTDMAKAPKKKTKTAKNAAKKSSATKSGEDATKQ